MVNGTYSMQQVLVAHMLQQAEVARARCAAYYDVAPRAEAQLGQTSQQYAHAMLGCPGGCMLYNVAQLKHGRCSMAVALLHRLQMLNVQCSNCLRFGCLDLACVQAKVSASP